jgi:transcription termination factor Rho
MNVLKRLLICNAAYVKVIASTFDERTQEHVKIANIVLEKQNDWSNVVMM